MTAPAASRRLRLGISTCPNDTFLFHGLLSGEIETPGYELEISLHDVQELNQRLLAGEFDVAKASYHLALQMADELVALPTGSALGFGNGPLLLARAGLEHTAPGPEHTVLCPGAHTTATLLYGLFHPKGAAPRHCVFSEVMPALESGEADFGVCIHEGRFTYEEVGLALVEDLGATWESVSSSPLPLGGLFARQGLDERTLDDVQGFLRRSLDYAQENPASTLATMQRHAQELQEEVLWSHVDLYVNGWTRDLGPVGARAIEELARRGKESGAVDPPSPLWLYEPLSERRLFHMVRMDPDGGLPSPMDRLEGLLEPPSLATEGFVHLSFREQLQGTLAVHFQGAPRVVLLELARERVGADVRFEASRGGALFPHLFRPIDLDRDVAGRWELIPGAGGDFELPALDRPIG